VNNCDVEVSYIRNKKIENSIVNIGEKDNLPLCMSQLDFNLINKVSNLIKINWKTFEIKKAIYVKNDKEMLQRVRNSHIKKGDIKIEKDDIYRYILIDKINKGNPFPGIHYHYNHKMKDYGLPKIIMCSGGYLMPHFDEKGIYNLSDNMLYLIVKNKSEYQGMCSLINSKLIKYLNKISMTDNIHGRDTVIKNMKQIDLSKIKTEKDIYKMYDISNEELKLIEDTI
jgi:hypothetical protein